MSINKKYKLTIEDEASLLKKLDIKLRLSILISLLIGLIILGCGIGMVIMAYSPLKTHLPGYMKDSERTATEQQHLRLDSLVKVYETNEAYIKSVLNALNPPDKQNADTTFDERKPVALKVDSILPLSEEELDFMEQIRERDKFNIPYSTSAAAQTMMFGSVNSSAIISETTKTQYQTELIVPEGSSISAIAEGKVISVASSPRYSGAYEVIIQHPQGFLSKTSRLSDLIVKPGDHVSNGQIIAIGSSKNGIKGNRILLELWHDGDPLIPSKYLNGGVESLN